jgi:type IV secretion system protein VirD4
VLLAAPTRTGKGVGFCVPNLLQFTDSAVVLDIKGENYNLTSEFRRRYMGNEIVYFNPFSENTHRWNPLSYISKDPNYRANDLMALASIIYPANDKDPFWPEAAKNFFVGLGLMILETPELPQTIGEILRQGSGKGMPIEQYIKSIVSLREISAYPLSMACRDCLNRFLNSGEQAIKGVQATFGASLNPWSNAVVDKATSGDDFDLRDVRKKKMTIYLHIPAGEILQAAGIIKLFFSQLINENVKELPEQNPALKYQCLLLLDEFTAMGKVEIIAKGVGYMAGYNMRLALVIQDSTQLEAVYGKEDAHNIISNMGAVIYFTPSQYEDAEKYSKMIGTETVNSVSKSRSRGGLVGIKASDNGSNSTSQQSRALMLPQELLQLSKDLQLIVRSGIPVIKADKIKYFSDRYFLERFTAVPMQNVTIGGDRRKVPVPTVLPLGNWDAYHAEVKTSDFYASILKSQTV